MENLKETVVADVYKTDKYSATSIRKRTIVMSMFVCLSVCLSVCLPVGEDIIQ